MTSTETVTDVLRDDHVDSCVEATTVAQSSFRLLIPSSQTLHKIRVFTRGFLSCSPVYGIIMYGVKGCHGEDVACELEMCAAQIPTTQSDGIMCSFTCQGHDYRYALLDIYHDAIKQDICEIYFY